VNDHSRLRVLPGCVDASEVIAEISEDGTALSAAALPRGRLDSPEEASNIGRDEENTLLSAELIDLHLLGNGSVGEDDDLP